MRLRVLLPCLFACLLAVWTALPLPASPAQSLSELQSKMRALEGKVGSKRGTERVLTSDIAGYTNRINGLQVKISSLQRREVTIQTELDRRQAQLELVQAKLRSERARL